MSADPGPQRNPEASGDPVPDSPAPDPVPRRKTTREAAEARRQAKLDYVSELVASGSLVIRPMTDEERQRYPPRPVQPDRMKRPWK